jgi:hypothetical protein
MERRLAILLGTTCALALGVARDARADFVPWSYNWEPHRSFVSSTTGNGRLYTSDERTGHAQGSSDIIVTKLRTASTAPRDHPDVFRNVQFSTSLAIVDGLNGQKGTVRFTGVFTGAISSDSSQLGFKLTSPRTVTLLLGNDLYTITFGHYSPPGPPGSGNTGSFTAFVKVSDPASHAPEPPAALLACVGGAGLGLAAWRRARQGRRGY